MPAHKPKINDANNYIPKWHISILKQRLKNMKEGKTVFHNWEEVKRTAFKVEDSNGKSNQN